MSHKADNGLEGGGIMFTDKRRVKSADDIVGDVSDADLERIPSVVKKLEQEAAKYDERLKEYIAAHKEKMNEMDRFRKKLEDDLENQVKHRLGELLKDMLVILDDIDRAIDASKEAERSTPLFEGFVMTRKKILTLLESKGLEEFSCVGEQFDPSYSQAIGVVYVDTEDDDNKVIEELSIGYKFNARVLRPSIVNVGKYSKNEQ